MNLGPVIKLLRKHFRITQEELALKSGTDSGNLSRIERGKQYPAEQLVKNIAASFGMRVSDLYIAMENMADGVSIEEGMARTAQAVGRVPLVSWVQAGSWSDIDDSLINCAEDWIPYPDKMGEGSFALTVRGDSMTAPYGESYPEGSIIFVDPTLHPENGDDVVAMMTNEKAATFKRYKIDDGDQRYLKPLNPQYQALEINGNCTICGVVVGYLVRKKR